MFRRTKKTKEPEKTQLPRFFNAESLEKSVSGEELLFSVGLQNQCPESKNKKETSAGIFSRLFRRKDSKRKSSFSAEAEVKQKLPATPTPKPSLWQRSKSILRPRGMLDRSESIVLELPRVKLNIHGSGSASQLLLNEFPIEEFYQDACEVAIEGLLMKIFDANLESYNQLKDKDRTRREQLSMMVRVINGENLMISPTATMNSLELCAEKMSKLSEKNKFDISFKSTECEPAIEGNLYPLDEEKTQTHELAYVPFEIQKIAHANQACEVSQDHINEHAQAYHLQDPENIYKHHYDRNHHKFVENVQLDNSWLLETVKSLEIIREKEISQVSTIIKENEECSELKVTDESGLSHSCCSSIDYKYDQAINEAEYNLEDLADMFDLLEVRGPEIVNDCTLRYVVKDSAGESKESLRFDMWSKDGLIIKKQDENKRKSDFDINVDVDSYGNEKGKDSELVLCNAFENSQIPLKQTQSSDSLIVGRGRLCKSVDLLNLTKITTSTDLTPPHKMTNLKARCQSLTPLKSKAFEATAGIDRRRSLGAKVSKIIAMFENVHFK